MKEHLETVEKDYVLAKGCFADVLLIVVGGPILFFAIAVALWLGVVFWPVVVLAIVAVAVLTAKRANHANRSRGVIVGIVAARESLPADVPGDGCSWVVRTESGDFLASGPELVEEWAQLGRVHPAHHVFDADRGHWFVAKDIVPNAYRRG